MSAYSDWYYRTVGEPDHLREWREEENAARREWEEEQRLEAEIEARLEADAKAEDKAAREWHAMYVDPDDGPDPITEHVAMWNAYHGKPDPNADVPF